MPTLCALTGGMQVPRWERTSPCPSGQKSALHDRKPWFGQEEATQPGSRPFDSKKVIRRNLFPGKKPDNWEVYDIVKDPAEKNNIAAENRDLINRAIAILDRNTNPPPDSRPCVTGPRNNSRTRKRERRPYDPPPPPF